MKHLGLFAKFWQAGRVKTRLAKNLGESGASLVYQLFVSHLLNQLKDAADLRSIVYSPSEREADFATAAGDSWQTVPQTSGDLGERMSHFLQQSLLSPTQNSLPESDEAKLSVRKTVVIGSDCPQLSPEDIRQAFDSLDHHPVVIGPSTDGGYYLIGMRNECANVFGGIDWSTDRVFDQTAQQLEQQSIEYSCLPTKTDIDELETLVEYHRNLKQRCQPGDPEFVLFHSLDGVLNNYREPQR